MAPRPFTDDGAVGAGGIPAGGAAPTSGAIPTPGASMRMPMGTSGGNQRFQGGPASMGMYAASNYKPSPSAAGSFNGLYFSEGGSVPSYDTGGAIPGPEDQDNFTSGNLDTALGTIKQLLQYGRKLNGFDTNGDGTGDDADSQGAIPEQQASNFGRPPMIPGTQSESGVPPVRPQPGPMPPAANPFGKRQAANMPMIPGGQSESGIPPVRPEPGKLPPTSNPFGKRTADAGAIPDGDDDDENGNVQSLADGGFVEPEDDPTPQPPISTDNTAPDSQTGDQPVPAAPTTGNWMGGANAPAQPGSPTTGLLEGAQNTAMNQGAKRVINYLMGVGAAPQQEVAAGRQAVDPQGKLPPGDANVLAVQRAMEMAGPEKAWPLMQANRQSYDMKAQFARAALNGTGGKPPDINAAAQAASDAYTHVLDGQSVQFTPTQQGVTATVKAPGGQTQQINLSPQQFDQFLNTGKDGQYDNLLESGGAQAVLAKIAQQSNPALRAGTSVARDVTQADQPALPGQFDAQGHDKSNYVNGKYVDPFVARRHADEAAHAADDMTAQQRARMMFPGEGSSQERQQFEATQEQAEAERENKLGVAEAGNKAKERIAKIQAGGRVAAQDIKSKSYEKVHGDQNTSRENVARIKAQADLQKLSQQNLNAQQRNAVRLALGEMMNPNMALMDDKQVEAIKAKYGIQNMMGQAPRAALPQAATPQARAPQAAPPAQAQGSVNDPLSQARDAIQRGAPRDAVIQRLREKGIDTTGL